MTSLKIDVSLEDFEDVVIKEVKEETQRKLEDIVYKRLAEANMESLITVADVERILRQLILSDLEVFLRDKERGQSIIREVTKGIIDKFCGSNEEIEDTQTEVLQ